VSANWEIKNHNSCPCFLFSFFFFLCLRCFIDVWRLVIPADNKSELVLTHKDTKDALIPCSFCVIKICTSVTVIHSVTESLVEHFLKQTKGGRVDF